MEKNDNFDENNDVKRRRVQSKHNKELPRYECFCAKQYLSYPALYLHLKNKHHTFFQNTKNGKRMEPTKLLESFDAHEGYKVYKIAFDGMFMPDDKKGQIFYSSLAPKPQYNSIKYAEHPYYSMNAAGYMPFPPMGFNFPYEILQQQSEPVSQKVQNQRILCIEKVFSMFIDHIQQRPNKQKKQIEILLSLFIDCINKNYTNIKDQRVYNKNIIRYSAQFNCDYIFSLNEYFENIYLPELAQDKTGPVNFFFKHSCIMKDKAYKFILNELKEFIFQKENNLEEKGEDNNESQSQEGEDQGDEQSESAEKQGFREEDQKKSQ